MTIPRADAPYTHRTATCRTCEAEGVTVLKTTRQLVKHREPWSGPKDGAEGMCEDRGVYDVEQPREA